MNNYVAISKRRRKHLAAGIITYMDGLRMWMLIFYAVADDQPRPFGALMRKTLKKAKAEGNESMKINDHDWIKMGEKEIEGYILKNTKNKYYPSKYKKVVEAEKKAKVISGKKKRIKRK